MEETSELSLQFIECSQCDALKLVGVVGRRIQVYKNGGGGTLKEPLKDEIPCPDCGNMCLVEN